MVQEFSEIRFPEAISYGSKGGPVYATSVVQLASGQEQRNSQWASPRHQYEVSQGLKNHAQLDELLGFFHARKGRATGFRLKDWADYQAVNQPLGTGTGALAVFPLRKAYSSNGQTLYRSITKPVAGTVAVYLNSVLQGSGFSVNTTTGIITFTAPPASGVAVSADFEFDVPVRFDTDRMLTMLDDSGSYSWGAIELVEVRV